jgi:hypothetical protein
MEHYAGLDGPGSMKYGAWSWRCWKRRPKRTSSAKSAACAASHSCRPAKTFETLDLNLVHPALGRKLRNPRTGAALTIEARRVVRFRVSGLLLARLNRRTNRRPERVKANPRQLALPIDTPHEERAKGDPVMTANDWSPENRKEDLIGWTQQRRPAIGKPETRWREAGQRPYWK